MFEVIFVSRQKRKLSQTGLYHIIFRGISRQNIFEEDSDYLKLKEIIKRVKKEMKAELYAYCFMTNHVHLFIKENNTGDISKIMTKILSHYATWFNIKYLRSGSLFANRYKSEPVEDERYYLGLTRYIHQNPLKAHMVNSIGAYPYSSYHEYLSNISDITDIDFSLDMLHDNRETAIRLFIELSECESEESFDITESQRKSPQYIRRIIMTETSGKEPGIIKEMPKPERDELIRKFVFEKGISKSALERAIGISRGTIIRVCQETRQ